MSEKQEPAKEDKEKYSTKELTSPELPPKGGELLPKIPSGISISWSDAPIEIRNKLVPPGTKKGMKKPDRVVVTIPTKKHLYERVEAQ